MKKKARDNIKNRPIIVRTIGQIYNLRQKERFIEKEREEERNSAIILRFGEREKLA